MKGILYDIVYPALAWALAIIWLLILPILGIIWVFSR